LECLAEVLTRPFKTNQGEMKLDWATVVLFGRKAWSPPIEQHVLHTNAGKQLSKAATDA
jgi:hypothetical protein